MRNLIKILNQVEKKVDSALSFIEYVEALRIWKGKKVIPKEEWLECHKSGQKKFKMKALATFPDDFVENIWIDDSKWYNNYIELLQKKRNSNYGKALCKNCLLNPAMQDAYGIRRVLMYCFEKHETPEDPCPVVNRFECPYPDKKDENSFSYMALENLQLVCETIDQAISEAMYRVPHEYNEYRVDFERGSVQCTNYCGGGWGGGGRVSVEDRLSKEFTDVPMRDVNDLFKAITNRERLGKLLDQKVSSIINPDTDLNPELRRFILDVFDDIKDSIRVEDLHEIHPTKEADDAIKYLEEHGDLKRLTLGQCTYCNAVANIHDTNCNKWLCKDHWREHQNASHADSIKAPH